MSISAPGSRSASPSPPPSPPRNRRVGYVYQAQDPQTHQTWDEVTCLPPSITRDEAIHRVRTELRRPNPDYTDVFVAKVFDEENDLFTRDDVATRESRQSVPESSESASSDSEYESSDSEDDEIGAESQPNAHNHSSLLSSSLSSSLSDQPEKPLPAVQAAALFPGGESAENQQTQEQAVQLFTQYPNLAQAIWDRFLEPPEQAVDTIDDIWETVPRDAKGPNAARRFALEQIELMNDPTKQWKVAITEEAMKELYEPDSPDESSDEQPNPQPSGSSLLSSGNAAHQGLMVSAPVNISRAPSPSPLSSDTEDDGFDELPIFHEEPSLPPDSPRERTHSLESPESPEARPVRRRISSRPPTPWPSSPVLERGESNQSNVSMESTPEPSRAFNPFRFPSPGPESKQQ